MRSAGVVNGDDGWRRGYLRCMWWHKKERPLREHLTEAIAKVNAQIDVQRRTSRIYGNVGPTGAGRGSCSSPE